MTPAEHLVAFLALAAVVAGLIAWGDHRAARRRAAEFLAGTRVGDRLKYFGWRTPVHYVVRHVGETAVVAERDDVEGHGDLVEIEALELGDYVNLRHVEEDHQAEQARLRCLIPREGAAR